jgi:hypothetical protein
MLGNGGGPDAGIGIGIGREAAGRGGGFAADGRGDSDSGVAAVSVFFSGSAGDLSFDAAAGDSGSDVETVFPIGSTTAFSVDAVAAARSELVFESDSRNSGIGCHADFASLQARSVALKLPSAIFSRMADSEKRPANCPFL